MTLLFLGYLPTYLPVVQNLHGVVLWKKHEFFLVGKGPSVDYGCVVGSWGGTLIAPGVTLCGPTKKGEHYVGAPVQPPMSFANSELRNFPSNSIPSNE